MQEARLAVDLARAEAGGLAALEVGTQRGADLGRGLLGRARLGQPLLEGALGVVELDERMRARLTGPAEQICRGETAEEWLGQ